MSDFLALVVDNNENQLHYIASFFRNMRHSQGREPRLAFLAPAFLYDRAKKFGEYDAVWTVDSEGFLQSDFRTGDWIVFLPFIKYDPQHEAFWRGWGNKTDFLQSLALIVMDCNLSGDTESIDSFFEGSIFLEELMAARQIGTETMKVLYTAKERGDPARVSLSPPKKAVIGKDLRLLASVMAIECEAHWSRLAGQKEFGLPLQYAALQKSTFGEEVGHGFANLLDSIREEGKQLEVAKSYMQAVCYGVEQLAARMIAAGFRTQTLAREVKRVESFRQRLSAIDVRSMTGNCLSALAQFDAAFANSIAVEETFVGEGLPCEKGKVVVTSFEDWRRSLCRIYLSHTKAEESWSEALRKLISAAGSGKFVVQCDVDEEIENVEIFMPHEWLLELFGYLRCTDTFLKNHARATSKVRFVVSAKSWAQRKREKSEPIPGVFKAGLSIGYDSIQFPPDLDKRTPRALEKLLSGPFAVESAKYLYDLFFVRASTRVDGQPEVYEFEIEEDRLLPKRRTDGRVPIWSRGNQGDGLAVPGAEFLRGGLTSAVVFLFEGGTDD